MSRRALLSNPKQDCKDYYLNWNFRNARIQAGYTGKELAEKTGIPMVTIYSYERLRALPTPRQAKELSKILGKNIEDLFPKKLREIMKEVNYERNNSSSIRNGPRGSLTNPYPLRQIQEELQAQNNETSQIDKSLEEVLGEVLQTLPDKRMRDIIKLRFGLIDENSYTLKEIGEIFGINKERARQIQNEAIEKLQHPNRMRLLTQLL